MSLTQSDLPPQKVPHVPKPSPAPTEMVDHEDRTVFRCLSCFSFFIPTEIKTDSRDSSESMPGAANLGEKGTTIGPSTEEFNSSGGLMGNHAQEGKKNYPATILEKVDTQKCPCKIVIQRLIHRMVIANDEEGEEGEEEGLSKCIGKEVNKLLQCHSHCK
ncbi:uncharacterized protein A4U43_C02F10860 [Asparagus officinalis]|uniref:Uncharacterized protein n=1 Tax=Asparagus officinalis TaxID=4686 RepID=A0A5P1FJB8_ASPOF|nr:uncharacterized protein A4U43_C02F10860 [Asparagus officinalis]